MLGISDHLGMKHSKRGLGALVFALLLLGPLGVAGAQEDPESLEEYAETPDVTEAESCEDCHAEGIDNAPVVTLKMLEPSVHDGFECESSRISSGWMAGRIEIFNQRFLRVVTSV